MVRKSDGILFGITSFGCGCGDARYPGVYAKVSYVLGWIYDTISKDSDIKRKGESDECQYDFTLAQH